MTGKQLLEILAAEMDADGLLDSEVYIADILDYLAIAGMDDAAELYQQHLKGVMDESR